MRVKIHTSPGSWAALLAALAVCACGSGKEPVPTDKSPAVQSAVAYANGHWFDGKSFVPGTRYVVGDVFQAAKPQNVALTIDLNGGYVVPPYAEGHNHLLEGEVIDTYIQHYLYRGVYYVKDQSGVPKVYEAIKSKLDQPRSIDVKTARQGFTGPGGHPLQIVGQMQTIGALPSSWTAEDIDGEAVIIIDSIADLDAKWPAFIAGKPDFVKIFLLYSEEHEKRKGDPAFDYRRGLDPKLAAPVVERARAAGLEVSAHVYTAGDFRTAVQAGANQIVHLPGVGYDKELGADAFRISDDDAAAAAKAEVTVISTLTGLVEDMAGSPEVQAYFEDVVRSNFQTLRVAGVPVLIGSDQFRRTTDIEVSYLSRLGLFDNLELLQVWSQETPKMIFPDRRIGELADGYEASFLVLEGNPLDEPSNLLRISLRVKQGEILVVGNPPFPPPLAKQEEAKQEEAKQEEAKQEEAKQEGAHNDATGNEAPKSKAARKAGQPPG